VLFDEESLLEAVVPNSVVRSGPITVALIDADHPGSVKSTSIYFNPVVNMIWKPYNVRRRDVQYLADLFTTGVYIAHEARTPYVNTFEDDMVEYIPSNTSPTLYILTGAYDPATFEANRYDGDFPFNNDKTLSTNAYIVRAFNGTWWNQRGRWVQYYQNEMEADGFEFGSYMSVAIVTQHLESDDETIIAAEFPTLPNEFPYSVDENPPVHNISQGIDFGVTSGLLRHTTQGLDYNG